MTNATEIKPTAVPEAAGKPRRKTRKPAELPASATNTRYFVGELDADGRIVLSTEFDSELEARLASFKLEQIYYEVDSWKAIANLSQGSIAVERQAVTGKGSFAGSGQVQKSHLV